MAYIRNVKLELLRPGKAHNQLLSPLTPYIALCGGEGPSTIHMPFEHQHLLNRLERLRYVTGGKEVSMQQRDSEVYELGEILGGILSQVPSLISTLGSAHRDRNQLVHLRLVTKAYEIALLPFEMSIASDGFPCSGSPLFLQSNEPITLTREVKGRHPNPVNWNRQPRILFAFASPGNLPAVPYQTHLNGLRRAIEPWVKYKDKPEDRINEVKKLLTVLPNASLQDIRDACINEQYTYIHILAHGDSYENQGHTNYGVALCSEKDPNIKSVIDGDTLAMALTAKNSLDEAQAKPTLVSLATCDSGNTGTTIVPGGSIAHALHAAGIPWIVASQFPLWMNASTIAAESLYEGIFKGEDPRWVLYNLRQRLRTDCMNTHDWASIIAYASVPWNFEKQVEAFNERQTKAKIEVLFDEAEARTQNACDKTKSKLERDVEFAEVYSLYKNIRSTLSLWRKGLSKYSPAKDHAIRLGISAASEKRIGTICVMQKNLDQANKSYQNACEFYKQALLKEPNNHWVITQYLSIRAILINSDEESDQLQDELHTWWVAAKQISHWQYENATGESRAWSLATLAELELLGSIYCNQRISLKTRTKQIVRCCRELVKSVGPGTFPVFSTRRQFKRYQDFWAKQEDLKVHKDWVKLSQAAIEELGDEDGSWKCKTLSSS